MVETRAPKFELVTQHCPCFCGGEGELVFYACERCAHVVLISAETHTVFPDPNNPDDANIDQGTPSHRAGGPAAERLVR